MQCARASTSLSIESEIGGKTIILVLTVCLLKAVNVHELI